MAPKFRGDSDDWLDDETQRYSRKAPSKKKKATIPISKTNAWIVEVFPNQCRVRLDEGGSEILCSYRRAEVFSKNSELKERSPVAVGDRVMIEKTGKDFGVVEGVAERTNSLYRLAPGRDSKNVIHVIASNVDALAIVASAHDPEFSTGLIDRYLVAAGSSGIEAVICVTKTDLIRENTQKAWSIYREIGIPVYEICAKTGQGIEKLRQDLEGRAIVFSGHSGVGKTTLLRTLMSAEFGRVGEVSEVTGKGRHTTTSAVMLRNTSFDEKTRWIDTPGVKEFGLLHVTPETLRLYFSEFRGLKCQQAGCFHEGEAGCEATELPRYANYRRILESIKSGEN